MGTENNKLQAISKTVSLSELELTDNKISNIAYEVVTEYYSLTIAYVHVIMKKAKRGEKV